MEFEEIFRRYFQDVYQYIRRLSGDGPLAEEITSETFFKALRSIDRFRGECDIRVWLFQIAKLSSVLSIRFQNIVLLGISYQRKAFIHWRLQQFAGIGFIIVIAYPIHRLS